MAIYRRSYIGRDGARRFVANFTVEFVDHRRRTLRVTGFASRTGTQALETNLRRLDLAVSSQMPPDAALRAWIESLPARIRDALVAAELLSPADVVGLRPLSEMLDEWTRAMEARDRAPRHVRESRAMVEALLTGIGAGYWAGLRAEAVEAWLLARRRDGLSVQTSNHYLAAAKAFGAWAVATRAASENPLARLKLGNAATDRRRERASLTAEQYVRLLAATSAGPAHHGMSGEERTLLYAVATQTGLRRGALLGLLVSELDFADAESPRIRVAAARMKNRRGASKPIHPGLARSIARHVAGRAPDARVWSCGLNMRTAECLRIDLAAAGVPCRDAAGRIVDFHALRVSTGTMLARGDVPLTVAQRHLGHSTSELTSRVYTVLDDADLRRGLAAIPDVPTEGTVVGGGAQNAANSCKEFSFSLWTADGGETAAEARFEAGGSRSESNRPTDTSAGPSDLKTDDFEPKSARLWGPLRGRRVADLIAAGVGA